MQITDDKLLLLISLSRISFLNLAEKINLLKKLDSSNDLALLSIEDIKKDCKRSLKNVRWNGAENLRQATIEFNIIKAKNINYVFYTDASYPALLREIVNAPFMLFYKGDISCLANKTVSVVGTRHVTPGARKATVDFAKKAALNGITVVSGIASGVDSASHLGVVNLYYDSLNADLLSNAGKTVAVLPCGCDSIVPKINTGLAERIIETEGCVLSEYVPGVSAEKFRYVHRNRIIAALSPATVVMQAPTGSGSLITADFALEYGRDVMFHEVALSENATVVNRIVERELDLQLVNGMISKSKRENTIKKFIDAGAPVIKDFKDYLKCLAEVPGIRSYKQEQLNLF